MTLFVPRSFYYDMFTTKNQLKPFNWQPCLKIILLVISCLTLTAHAENYPNLNNDEDFSLMGALANRDWHNIEDERWNLYTQGTYITNYHPSFPAAYTNLNDTPNSFNLAPSALGQYQNQIEKWKVQANDVTNSYNATTGTALNVAAPR